MKSALIIASCICVAIGVFLGMGKTDSSRFAPSPFKSLFRCGAAREASAAAVLPDRQAAVMPPIPATVAKLPADRSGYLFASNASGIAYASSDVPSAIHFKPLNFNWQPVLILEVPDGLELINAFRGIRILAPEKVLRNGANYLRYTILPDKNATKFTFFWKSTLKPGTRLIGYYHGQWEHGSQEEQSLPIEIVSIPRASTFKRLPVWFSIPADMAAIWPGFENYRRVGFNTVDIWTYARPTERSWGGKLMRSVLEKATATGTRVIAWTREWWWEDAINDPEAQATSLSGGKVKALCPSYRKKHFQAFCEQGRYLIDNGLYFHSVDPEIYRNAGKICFCEICKANFRNYVAQRYPGRQLPDPSLFMKAAGKYPEEVKIWNRFKAWEYAQIFADYRHDMEKYMRSRGVDEKFQLMIYSTYHRASDSFYGFADYEKAPPYLNTMEDPKVLAEVFDYLSPMVYPDVYAVGKDYDMTVPWQDTVSLNRIVGRGSSVVPLLSPGFAFIDPYNRDNSPEMIRYNILEAIAGGAKGFGFWGACPLDAADMKAIAEAVNMLVPVEEVIENGVPFESAAESGRAFVKGVIADDRALLLVSEYSRRRVDARVRSPLAAKKIKVTDLVTGKEVPVDSNTFEVSLDSSRAIMFLIVAQ